MRFVIKLSGEGIGSKTNNFSEDVIERIAHDVKKLQEEGHSLAIVIGGGNIFRARDLKDMSWLMRQSADYMGMLGTVQNSLVLRDYMIHKGIDTRVVSAISMPQISEEYIPQRVMRHMEKGRLIIFSGGLGLPYFTTDTCSVQRALEIGSDMMVMAKNGTDGVYTADPNVDKNAKKLKSVSASDVVDKGLTFADLSSVAMAKENGLRIKVVNILQLGEMLEESIGSVVEPT